MSATIIDLAGRRDTAEPDRAVPHAQDAAVVELRRARLRIAQLERNLTVAMRESLINYKRAREAERLLETAPERSG